MRPKVTVITVCYNSERDIAVTMESVLAQTYAPYEYLIIDGESTDATLEIADRYMEAFKKKGTRLRIHSGKDNGIYDAMNKGIRMAEGDYIGFINCGDYYEPDAIRTSMGVMKKFGADVTFADIILHRTNGKSPIRKKARFGKIETTRYWNHPTMFARTELYRAHPFRGLGIADDYRSYLEMKNEGATVATIPKVLAHFQMGGASNVRSLSKSMARMRSRYDAYRDNGYSRAYMIECLAIELAKFLLG